MGVQRIGLSRLGVADRPAGRLASRSPARARPPRRPGPAAGPRPASRHRRRPADAHPRPGERWQPSIRALAAVKAFHVGEREPAARSARLSCWYAPPSTSRSVPSSRRPNPSLAGPSRATSSPSSTRSGGTVRSSLSTLAATRPLRYQLLVDPHRQLFGPVLG
jgi:hypothetical protein